MKSVHGPGAQQGCGFPETKLNRRLQEVEIANTANAAFSRAAAAAKNKLTFGARPIGFGSASLCQHHSDTKAAIPIPR